MTDTFAYTYVNWSNMTTFSNFIQNANSSGAGYLFAMIDFLVFTVLFVTLSTQFGWESALLSSGFIGIILSLFFAYMGVMNWWITSFFVGTLLIMILYTTWNRND